ncbi:antitermination protein [[Haemophilus] felis]|nr:antitermination protein [[Haemophilus] felis]
MRKDFGGLKLTQEQELWVKEWLYKWGAWIRSGRLDKRQVNIIGRLMQSVQPADPQDPICTDDEGLAISIVIDQFFASMDKELHFIVYGFYVYKMTINKLATKIYEQRGEQEMQGCAGKPDIRKPSHKTVKREVKERLELANGIIHELLVNAFIVLRTGSENSRKIKIRY